MIRYQKISGVSLDETSSLGKVLLTDEGRAMGSIPGWALFNDPEFITLDDNSIRNRAIPNGKEPARFGTVNSSANINGIPAIAAGIEGEENVNFLGNVGINPLSWTYFVVFEQVDNESGVRNRLLYAQEGDFNEPGPHLTSDGEDGSEVRLWASREDLSTVLNYSVSTPFVQRGAPTLLMVTASQTNGASIFDGGERVAQTANYNQVWQGGFGPGEWSMMNNFKGKIGVIGVLNIDLGAPENTGHRRAIEKFMMAKYDIPEGPQ